MVKSITRRVINGLLSPLGLEVRRVDSPRLFPEVYGYAIAELMGAFEALGFSPLPYNERRMSLMRELMGAKISESIYLLHYLRQGFEIEGDVCEFGVGAGTTSALIANEMRDTDKNLWLFDSFQGLSKPTKEDVLIDDVLQLGSMEKYEGAMSHPEATVRAQVEAIGFPKERLRVVPGFVEESLGRGRGPDRVAFAYVDMDLYSPIKCALEHLDGVLSTGGIVMVDDYGFLSAGAQTAVDEFVASRSEGYNVIHPHKFAGKFVLLQKR